MDSEASNFVRKVIPSGHICTHTGRAVDPANFKADDVCLEDIAHALSMICRFNGHTKFHYSVAQHSVHGSLEFCASDIDVRHDPLLVSKWFLLHDAAEAYLNDMSSPVKHDPIMAGYREREEEATWVIFGALGVNPEYLSLVKEHDDKMFANECDWFWGHREGGLHCWTPEQAEKEFLTEYYMLHGVEQ
jgi:hypothetical protein